MLRKIIRKFMSSGKEHQVEEYTDLEGRPKRMVVLTSKQKLLDEIANAKSTFDMLGE